MLTFYNKIVKKGHAVYELMNPEQAQYQLVDLNTEFTNITGMDGESVFAMELQELVRKLGLNWNLIENSLEFGQKDWRIFYSDSVICRGSIYEIEFLLQDSYLVIDLYPMKKTQENTETEPDEEDVDLFFNSTQDALFVASVEHQEFRYLKNNLYHQELTGLSPDKFRGKTPIEVLGEEAGLRHEQYFRQCLETGDSVYFEEKINFKGLSRDFFTKITPFQKNNKTYIVGSRMDISLLKETMKSTEELLNRFQSLFDKHKAVMLILEPESGEILDANPAAVLFYGYSHEELITMRIQDINIMNEEELRVERRRALMNKQVYFLFRHRLKNGQIRFVDAYSSPVEIDGRPLLYSIIFDATERELYKKELYNEKELLRITLDSIGEAVITINTDGMITRINQQAAILLETEIEEVVGKPFSEVVYLRSEDDNTDLSQEIFGLLNLESRHVEHGELLLINRFDQIIPVSQSTDLILDREDRIHGAVMILRDIRSQKQEKEEIIYLSYHDTLTGLYNRRFYELECEKYNHMPEAPYGILIGDVNGLKIINDVFGHVNGDVLIKEAASVIDTSIEKEHKTFRWGGDEFVALIPEATLEYFEELLPHIVQNLRNNRINDIMEISVSFGYAVKDQQEQTSEQVLKRAEEMMYRIKMTESKSLRKSIIDTVMATIHEKSEETEEHSIRLSEYLTAMGIRLGLNPERLGELKLLAALHDIGKVGVPHHILMKAGSLTDAEWVEMKKHSEIGYHIALNVPELTHVAESILYHHEHWDGKGYPQGLKGREIPLNSRILAVADAYDAMTNDRVYRKAIKPEEVKEEIKLNAGIQFDPEIVDIFLELI